MKTVNVRELKNNPSEALRMAKKDVVVVMNRDKPDALLLHLDESKMSLPGVKMALATALFRDGSLPVGRAARIADMALVEFIQHLSRIGIPVIGGTDIEQRAQLNADIAALDQWLEK
jgi:predicted HTH domain antitoxin